MSRERSGTTVRWSANIPSEDMTRFSKAWPVNGMLTALMAAALEEFLDEVETNPFILGKVKADIQHHLYNEDKGTSPHQLSLRIPNVLYARFINLFPEFGATTWFMRRVFYGFLEQAGSLSVFASKTVISIFNKANTTPEPSSAGVTDA